MNLYQIKPYLQLLYATNNLEEMNAYIRECINPNHQAEWIEKHLEEKQRHFIILTNTDDSLHSFFVVLDLDSLMLD